MTHSNSLEPMLMLLVELGGMRQHLRKLETDARGVFDGSGFWKAVEENEARIELTICEVKKLTTPNAIVRGGRDGQ